MAIIAQVNPTGTGTVTAASWGVDYITSNGTTPGTLAFDPDAANGTTSVLVTQGNGALFGAFSAALGGTKSDLWLSFEIKLTGYPSASNHIFAGVSGATNPWFLDISGTGALLLRDSANANVKQLGTPIPLNTWCRGELHVAQSGATSTAQLQLYTSVNSSTATEDSGSFTASAAGLGTGTDQVQFGVKNATPQVPPFRLGHVAVGSTKVGAFGAPTVAPPTVNAGPDLAGSVGQAILFGAAATATPAVGGTITGYQWTQVANGAPAVTIANPTSLTGATFTPAAAAPSTGQAQPYQFRLTVTQTG